MYFRDYASLVKFFAEFTLSDEAATAALAGRLAPLLRAGDVVLLRGDLGAGKTSFARGAIRALLGAETEVTSPTFTLAQLYELPGLTLWHFDLYRLEREEEITAIGWEEARAGIALVEWPERLGCLKPDFALNLAFDFTDKGRKVIIEGDSRWHERLKGFT